MRILLADDQAEVLLALRMLLEQEPGLRVIGEATEADGLLAQTRMTQPDLVMIDWELPNLQESKLVSNLRALCPHLKVIALSGRPEARQEALMTGVDAFISKGDPPEGVLSTLRAVRGSAWRTRL